MRALRLLTRIVCVFAFATVGLAEEPARDSKAVVSAGDAALLQGLSLVGTMKQIIGSFDTYGHPSVGCTFELNLAKLPEQRIDFTRPVDPRGVVQSRAYVPLRTPLSVATADAKQGLIRLSSPGGNIELTIEITASEFAKGAKARIYFLEVSYGRIRCMAEAEGVLQ